jgi:hypothetical protein
MRSPWRVPIIFIAEKAKPMTIHHPLDILPANLRKPLFYAALAATLLVMAVFRLILDPPLRTTSAPNGIVSFELAGTPLKAGLIVSSWDTNALLFTAFGLGFDFLFMPVYATAIALGVLLAAGRHPGRFSSVGAWVGWGAFAAALFDAAENVCLFKILLGSGVSSYPQIAALYATVKFGLILLGMGYALLGWALPKRQAK